MEKNPQVGQSREKSNTGITNHSEITYTLGSDDPERLEHNDAFEIDSDTIADSHAGIDYEENSLADDVISNQAETIRTLPSASNLN